MLNRLKTILSHPVAQAVLVMGLFLFIQKLFVFYGFHHTFNDFYHKHNATWNITQGNGMFVNLWGRSYLANHFYPFHYLIALGYLVFMSPIWLLGFQVICQVFLTWAIMQFSYERLGKKAMWISLILLFLYYPFRRFNIEPLFGETLMAPLIAWIIYFLYHRKDRWVFVLTALLLLCKENAATFVVMLGVYYMVFRKQYKTGVIMMLCGVLHAIYLIKVFIPSMNPNPEGYDFSSYYDYLGGSVPELLKSIFLSPSVILGQMLSGDDILYVFSLVFPLGFLSFFSHYIILGLGTLMQNLLASGQRLMTDPAYHVSYPLWTVLWMTAILGFEKWRSRPKHIVMRVAKGFVYLGVFLNILMFIFLDVRVFFIDQQTIDTHKLLSRIPERAPVSASKYIGAHLSARERFYRFPDVNDAEYVIVEQKNYFFKHREDAGKRLKTEYKNGNLGGFLHAVIFQPAPPKPIYYKKINELKASPEFQLIDKGQNVLLFKRVSTASQDVSVY